MWKVLMAAMVAIFATFSPARAAMDSNRIVTAVDYVAKTFSCHAKAKEPSWTYKTTNKTVFRTVGRMRRGSFSDIKVGEIVSVRYDLHGDDRIADRVVIKPKP
jgi:hypothetical protein